MEGNGLDNVWLNLHWFEEMWLFLRKVMWNVFFYTCSSNSFL